MPEKAIIARMQTEESRDAKSPISLRIIVSRMEADIPAGCVAVDVLAGCVAVGILTGWVAVDSRLDSGGSPRGCRHPDMWRKQAPSISG